MKSVLLAYCLLGLFSPVVYGQVYKGAVDFSKIPVTAPHYQEEYTYDSTVNVAAWKALTKGLHLSFASTDQSYFRTEVPALVAPTLAWSQSGWKGERLNAQILVWSKDTVNQVHFIINNLRNAHGKVLSKKNIRLDKVSYVLSNYPYNANDASCGGGPSDRAYLLPDRFSPLTGASDRFDVPGMSVRPVWLAVNIPNDAEPGIYNGIIKMISTGGDADLNISITVQDLVLPSPHDWKFRLDLWQNPWVIADYYHVKPWSDEHKALLKKHLQLYADAGGTFITTYGVHSPWGDNEYSIEGGMVEWIKQKNGSWKFDYSIFDQYVQLAMSVGIERAITIYTPIPWGERFRYLDEHTGNYVYERWQPTSDTFRTNWNAFLTDLKNHLEKKGWFNKTYLGVNENAMEQTLSAIKVIRAHSPKWRITYAGDWHRELDTLLDDYSAVFGREPNVGEVQNRSAHSRTSTFYICCTPPKPNTFIFSPPVEGRWLGWYTYAHHYDGFLRWAYDAWPADPLRDARFGSWAAGDCFLMYPGASSSIRFEKLREGIVDYEKIGILKQKAKASSNKEVKQLMQELDNHMQAFNDEKSF
ncbi:MAG TPA: glycoside hydrolase domain-containing protein, partial [Chitinophagaceae bacterium]|nr:glycoside hydrolase domain-containing protein [Chitinophagaceae bacterium]